MTNTTTALDAERADLLTGFAAARTALIAAAEGVTDEQAAQRTTVSELTLGGLIKHVTFVENNWRRVILDGPASMDFSLPEGVTWEQLTSGTATEYPQWMIEHENNLRMLPGDTLDALLAAYRQAAAHTDEAVATVPDLNASHTMPDAPWEKGGPRTVRLLLLHVLAEISQHAGHADLIRESLDGRKAS